MGFMIASLLWVAVVCWVTSYAPTDPERAACYQAAAKGVNGVAECKSFWEKTTSDPIAAFTLVLAVSTIGLWIATIGLYVGGEKHSERGLRAYIVGTVKAEISNFNARARPDIALQFKNGGQTPAHDVRLWASSAIAMFPLTSRPDAPKSELGEGDSFGVIGPQGDFHSLIQSDFVVTAEEQHAVVRGAAALYVYGEVTYRDAFGQDRRTSFCHLYQGEVARSARGSLALYHMWNEAT